MVHGALLFLISNKIEKGFVNEPGSCLFPTSMHVAWPFGGPRLADYMRSEGQQQQVFRGWFASGFIFPFLSGLLWVKYLLFSPHECWEFTCLRKPRQESKEKQLLTPWGPGLGGGGGGLLVPRPDIQTQGGDKWS